jgi:hypothetical protein
VQGLHRKSRALLSIPRRIVVVNRAKNDARKQEKKREKLFCYRCGKHTNHTVLEKKEIRSHPDDPEQWAEDHYFGECAGCDAITYAIEFSHQDDWNPNTGEIDSTWKTYPRASTARQAMNDDHHLPGKISSIYQEVIGAMNSQLPVLSAIGLRALIEAICRDRNIAGGNLQKLIDGLATSGVLSNAQATILHGHRFLGNVAAHEIVSPKPKELVAALEIAETLMRTIYVLPELSKHITTGKKP